MKKTDVERLASRMGVLNVEFMFTHDEDWWDDRIHEFQRLASQFRAAADTSPDVDLGDRLRLCGRRLQRAAEKHVATHGKAGGIPDYTSQQQIHADVYSALTEINRLRDLPRPKGVVVAPSPLVFISHDAAEVAIAEILDALLTRRWKDKIRVFIANRDIPVGEEAFKRLLKENLLRAAAVISICTPRSRGTPWLYWETASLWAKRKYVFPVFFGIGAKTFGYPMALIQGARAKDRAQMDKLLGDFGQKLRLSTPAKITDAEWETLSNPRLAPALGTSSADPVALHELGKRIGRLRVHFDTLMSPVGLAVLSEAQKLQDAAQAHDDLFSYLTDNRVLVDAATAQAVDDVVAVASKALLMFTVIPERYAKEHHDARTRATELFLGHGKRLITEAEARIREGLGTTTE